MNPATNFDLARLCEVRTEPYQMTLREFCGLAHDSQVVEVTIPSGVASLFSLRDKSSGRLFPVQRSEINPTRGYLQVALGAYEVLVLALAGDDIKASAASRLQVAYPDSRTCHIGNGSLELEVPWGSSQGDPTVSGPVKRVRAAGQPWRGRTFLDVATPPVSAQGEFLENGPLRVVYRYRVEWKRESYYEAVLTVDADRDFVSIAESFAAGTADQVVWDFVNDDLPREMFLLDDTAGQRSKQLQYHYDQRHARLWCWTQYAQLHDLSDGYAVVFPETDAIGFVTLQGGKWKGNRLNHLEAWTRRWLTKDPATRRLPADAKADSYPTPEKIPARGLSHFEAHFSVEGWIGRGSRSFALVVTTRDKLLPEIGRLSEPIPKKLLPAPSHYEQSPDIERFQAHQSLLRKISTQVGTLSLQAQMEIVFSWPLEPAFEGAVAVRKMHPIATEACGFGPSITPEKRLHDYLSARVLSFWHAGGPVSSNAVAARALAPLLSCFEMLACEARLTFEQIKQYRAWYSFLTHLFASDDYYPGKLTMSATEEGDSSEPTLAGMANQNFYTDVVNLPGMAAQIFSGHPEAQKWRERFRDHWRLQLEFHTYPESGLWEESHTYYQHVLNTVLPLLLRRRVDGLEDEFKNPRLQKMIEALVRQLSPRDAYSDGHRHILALGDHDAFGARMFLPLYMGCAEALQTLRPDLARMIYWAYLELGGNETIAGIEAEPFPWKSEKIEGLGAFFRIRDAENEEGLLLLRSGAAWAHHHQDDGSIQLFGGGRALIVDSAFSHPQVRGALKFSAGGHSRALPAGVDPFNVFWRFNRGWIVDSSFEGNIPYAVAYTPTYMTSTPGKLAPLLLPEPLFAFRAIVAIGPAAFLLIDYNSRPIPCEVRFHLAGTALERNPEGVSAKYDNELILEIKSLQGGPVEGQFPINESSNALPQTRTSQVDFAIPPGKRHAAFSLAYGKATNPRLIVRKTDGGCLFNNQGKSYEMKWLGESSLAVVGVGTEIIIDFAKYPTAIQGFALGQ